MGKFKNIGIAGLGLIGGSLAIEIKKRGIACRVTGFSKRPSTLKKAKNRGIIDEYFLDFEEGIAGLDFLIISTPIGVMNGYFSKIARRNPSLLVTDAASVKEKVVKDAEAILGKDSNFVGSHPMAGSEKSGIDAAVENLFENRFVIITPSRHTKKENVTRVKGFWKSIGAVPLVFSPGEHDSLVAATSHLPHLAVFSMIALVEKAGKKNRNLNRCIGAGFLDTTRIGKSNPELWAEIFTANRKNLLLRIGEFEKSLSEMKEMLEKDACGKLAAKLDILKKTREKWDGKKQCI